MIGFRMTTNAEEEPPPPDRRDIATRALRVAISGHPDGSVRRILLWCALVTSIALGMFVAQVTVLAILLAGILAMTDDLS